jgi:RNA polymerase sigma-70 factor (ECF subfamily)
MSLNQTIINFRNGNNLAFEQLHDQYSNVLLRICLRFARNVDDAKDMLQEGFIKIYKHRQSYNQHLDSGFYAWAKKIIINNNIDFCKKNYKHRISPIDVEALNSHSEINDTNIYKPEVALNEGQLLNLVNSLPDGYRTIFTMYVLEGLSHQEIANFLNISLNTSKSQLSRARKLLQKQIRLLKKHKDSDSF